MADKKTKGRQSRLGKGHNGDKTRGRRHWNYGRSVPESVKDKMRRTLQQTLKRKRELKE